MSKLSKHHILFAALLSLLAIAPTSCINEDWSDCESVLYDLRLITNMEIEMRTILDAEADSLVKQSLRNYLKDIFIDYAHDVDLSFYSTDAEGARLHHDQRIMNATERSFSLFLPVYRYMHTAVANVQNNGVIKLRNDEYCKTTTLATSFANDRNSPSNIIPVQRTGLFSARLPIEIEDAKDQSFFVHLYMVNCATALVLDRSLCDYTDIKIYTTGFATDFHVADSVFIYPSALSDAPLVSAEQVPVDGNSSQICFCSVNYPSPEPVATRSVVETTEPFLSRTAAETLWQYRCYVTLADGTTTESIISLRTPLRAGQLKILKGHILPDGEVFVTSDVQAGVSVTLDWKEGGIYNPQL